MVYTVTFPGNLTQAESALIKRGSMLYFVKSVFRV